MTERRRSRRSWQGRWKDQPKDKNTYSGGNWMRKDRNDPPAKPTLPKCMSRRPGGKPKKCKKRGTLEEKGIRRVLSLIKKSFSWERY